MTKMQVQNVRQLLLKKLKAGSDLQEGRDYEETAAQKK